MTEDRNIREEAQSHLQQLAQDVEGMRMTLQMLIALDRTQLTTSEAIDVAAFAVDLEELKDRASGLATMITLEGKDDEN